MATSRRQLLFHAFKRQAADPLPVFFLYIPLEGLSYRGLSAQRVTSSRLFAT